MPKVFLALPSYDGRLDGRTAHAAYATATRGMLQVGVGECRSSLLANGFNSLWCDALNMAAEGGCQRFAMLHADIVPDPGWLDVLERALREFDLDLVSCVVPIKDERGVTSTGVGDPRDPWKVLARVTMRQVRRLPEVFGSVDLGKPGCPLLVNTGCWLARLDRGNWQRRVHFEIRDRIVVRDQKLVPENLPEDWHFSRQLHDLKVRYAATSRVTLTHVGLRSYPGGDEPWGTWEHDEHYDPAGEVRPVEEPTEGPV